MGIWRSRYTHRADASNRPLVEAEKSRKVRRGLNLEPLEERMLLTIGFGPDLEEVLSSDGAPLVAGDSLQISPRELLVRFDDKQSVFVPSATAGGIRVFRS